MEAVQWKIIAVAEELADTKTFVLEPLDGRPVSWQAGQFLTFLFEHDIRRSYSICTTPGIDKHIAVTVKRKVNGEVSRHILRHWKKGSIVTSLAPAGRFTINGPASHYYFIAAGSGIVPIFGLIKQVLFYQPNSQVTLFYQNRDERSVLFDKQLRQLYLHRIDFLSNPLAHDVKPARLNNWLLENMLAAMPTNDALFYTCGPESFMRMVQFTLRLMGFHENQLRKEHFVIDPPRKPAFTIEAVPRTVLLQHGHATYRFTSTFPNTILNSAKQNGIELPYSCNTGRCGTCVARCRRGTVAMSNNEVLTDADLRQGLILTCTGFPTTDIELIF